MYFINMRLLTKSFVLILLTSLFANASEKKEVKSDDGRKRLRKSCVLDQPLIPPDYTEQARNGELGLLPETASKEAILEALLGRTPLDDDYKQYDKLKRMIGLPPVPFDYWSVPIVEKILGHFPTITEYAEFVSFAEVHGRDPTRDELTASLVLTKELENSQLPPRTNACVTSDAPTHLEETGQPPSSLKKRRG